VGGAADGSRAVILVLDGDVEVPIWYLDERRRADLGVVDAIARLQLGARRLGWTIRLQNPCTELTMLLRFAGMAEVLGLPLELCGEAEGLEQLGVEEVVETDDPAV
jgi:hypothetical protein